LSRRCWPPSAMGRMWAASRTGRAFSPVTAAALVVVRHQDAEGALAQPRADEHRISVDPRRLLGRDSRRSREGREAGGHLVPKALAGGGLRVVVLPLDDVQREVRRRRDPQGLVEEEGVPKEDAADRVVGPDRCAAVFLDSPPHLVLGRGPVLLTESVPDETPGEADEADEEAAAGDVVFRVVKLEEQRFIGGEGLEGSAPGHPEVHLVHIRQAPQEAEPIVVGDGYS
jgi:hypothetical protein